MAWVPVAFVLMGLWAVRGSSRGAGRPGPVRRRPITANTLRGPGQPAQAPVTIIDMRPPPVPDGHRVEVAGPVRKDQLQAIDALFGSAVAEAVADAVAQTPVDPLQRATDAAGDPARRGSGRRRHRWSSRRARRPCSTGWSGSRTCATGAC